MINGEIAMAGGIEEPKRYKIPSSSYGTTASEAAETLLRAEEIKENKPLHKAALTDLKLRKKVLNKIV